MTVKPAVHEQFGPIFDKLIPMVGAARNAFNRHDRISLEELKNLQVNVAQEMGTTLKQLEGMMVQQSEPELATWRRYHSIFTHLQIMGETLGALADPIQKKIKDGVLFSDKAVSQTNYLFDNLTGLLRSLLDIIKTDNDFLKKYTQEVGQKLVQSCIEFATEHQARLIEGLCLPQASPIFLAILDRLRITCQHGVDIARMLSK